MDRTVVAFIKGGLRGTLGTLAMSAVMLVARRAGLLTQQPPERIVDKAFHALGRRRQSRETRHALATLLHLGFGTAVGALFGILQRWVRLPGPSILHGVAYAALVWAVSYKGWIPALGILPPPERDRPSRPAVMLAAHGVYGAVLGLTLGRGDERTG